MVKIDEKIVGVEIVKDDDQKKQMNVFKLPDRPKKLFGTTYKLRGGNSEHSIYLTINDHEVNGHKIPYEIFLNTKSSEALQWKLVFTRLISSIFRRDAINPKPDLSFLVEELLSVYDPSDMFYNGEFSLHPTLMPSTVAYIGHYIKHHLIGLGIYTDEKFATDSTILEDKFNHKIEHAKICPKCNAKAFVKTDCWMCLECGYSKCD
jgi:ribonucleoside-diphosphate reductase alpha chain